MAKREMPFIDESLVEEKKSSLNKEEKKEVKDTKPKKNRIAKGQ